MRIASSTISENLIRQIQALSTQQSRLQSQVATGQRITAPEDDPAAVGRVLSLESERRALEQYGRNATRALELSQATFSGLQQVKRLSDRATEIGTLGAGVANATARQSYASEVDQLIEQAAQLGNTRFGNDYLYAGTAVDTPPLTITRDAQGRVTLVAYAGNAAQAGIQLSDTASVTPGSTGATNQRLVDFVNHLVALRDSLQAGDTAGITAAQTSLIGTEDGLVSDLAEQGAVQMRIEVNQAQQADRISNLERLVSSEADVDLPSAIVKLNQTQTAYQAALQSSANIMQISLLDYIQ